MQSIVAWLFTCMHITATYEWCLWGPLRYDLEVPWGIPVLFWYLELKEHQFTFVFICLFVKFQEQSGRFKEIEDRALAAEQQLQEYTSSWEDQKKAKAAEAKKLEARCADLVNQNSTLHSQLEKVGINSQ